MTVGQLFILSAPSGAGKSTLLQKVFREVSGIGFSVSHTTRLPRSGEVEGREYYFVSEERFRSMISGNAFLEYAEVHGNYYGTSREAVTSLLRKGEDVFLDIDVQGARILRERDDISEISIFLAPPSVEELEKRLRARGSDSDATIALRLANARTELQAVDEYDYLVVNENLDDAVRMLAGIVLAERARHRRMIDGGPAEVQCVNGEEQSR